jgi:hypothetical protein
LEPYELNWIHIVKSILVFGIFLRALVSIHKVISILVFETFLRVLVWILNWIQFFFLKEENQKRDPLICCSNSIQINIENYFSKIPFFFILKPLQSNFLFSAKTPTLFLVSSYLTKALAQEYIFMVSLWVVNIIKIMLVIDFSIW